MFRSSVYVASVMTLEYLDVECARVGTIVKFARDKSVNLFQILSGVMDLSMKATWKFKRLKFIIYQVTGFCMNLLQYQLIQNS